MTVEWGLNPTLLYSFMNNLSIREMMMMNTNETIFFSKKEPDTMPDIDDVDMRMFKKPATSPMVDDIDITQMYQHQIAPLNLSEEQKKSLSDEEYSQSVPVYRTKPKAVPIRTEIDFTEIGNPLEMTDESKTCIDDFYRDALHQAIADEMKKFPKPTMQHYREPATSKSSRFGATGAFIMDCTPIQFDGPLDRSGFIREIILAVNDRDSIDVVRYPVEVDLSYSDRDPAVAVARGSMVLTPALKTINGSTLNYFAKTDADDLAFDFQLDCSVESDTGVVRVTPVIQIISKDFIMPFSVSIIAVDLHLFKKQENTMTENPNTDNTPTACLNGHLQLRPDDVTFTVDGTNSALATFTVPDEWSNATVSAPHFRLKPIINELRFEKMYPDVKIPQKQTPGSAGMDVHAYLPESVVIPPGERRLIPTGLKTCFPEWMELQVRSRSGLALKHGIIVLNAPGTIDADYPGELGVILYNTSMTPYLVQHDARIAQLVPAQVLDIPVVEGVREEDTTRTSAGFGSTGV